MRLSKILTFCIAEIVFGREETFGLVEFKAIVCHDKKSLCINNHKAVDDVDDVDDVMLD